MTLKNKILPLALLAVILLSCQKNAGTEPKVGNPAPSLSLSDLNGNTVKLESLKGKVVILNFWSYT